jgi:chromosome segregation ATPase
MTEPTNLNELVQSATRESDRLAELLRSAQQIDLHLSHQVLEVESSLPRVSEQYTTVLTEIAQQVALLEQTVGTLHQSIQQDTQQWQTLTHSSAAIAATLQGELGRATPLFSQVQQNTTDLHQLQQHQQALQLKLEEISQSWDSLRHQVHYVLNNQAQVLHGTQAEMLQSHRHSEMLASQIAGLQSEFTQLLPRTDERLATLATEVTAGLTTLTQRTSQLAAQTTELSQAQEELQRHQGTLEQHLETQLSGTLQDLRADWHRQLQQQQHEVNRAFQALQAQNQELQEQLRLGQNQTDEKLTHLSTLFTNQLEQQRQALFQDSAQIRTLTHRILSHQALVLNGTQKDQLRLNRNTSILNQRFSQQQSQFQEQMQTLDTHYGNQVGLMRSQLTQLQKAHKTAETKLDAVQSQLQTQTQRLWIVSVLLFVAIAGLGVGGVLLVRRP